MKPLIFIVIAVWAGCAAPNNSASTRTSTAPMSNDPTTTVPGTGANPPLNNRIEPKPGTAPTNESLPPVEGSSTGTDSTARR